MLQGEAKLDAVPRDGIQEGAALGPEGLVLMGQVVLGGCPPPEALQNIPLFSMECPPCLGTLQSNAHLLPTSLHSAIQPSSVSTQTVSASYPKKS